jgi:bacterioferritin-associated ferredoxin
MYVCYCGAVNDREVRDAVAHGARSIEDLQERCNAGSDCGGCHPALAELLACDAHHLVGATPTR